VSDLGLPNAWRLEAAAMLSQLGCVSVYPDTVEAIFAGEPVSEDERERFSRHPVIASRLLERIPRLEYVASLVGLLGGRPDLDHGRTSLEDPNSVEFGAEVIRTCIEFDRLLRTSSSPRAATMALQSELESLDPIIESLTRLPSELLPFETRYVSYDKLELKMLLDQEVRTNKGVLLIAKWAEVTEPLLLRLQAYHARGVVQGEIRVLTRQTIPVSRN
jgi:hypothetical protein